MDSLQLYLDDIGILSADKCCATVMPLLSRKKEDYHDKLMSLLSDKKFHKVFDKDPIFFIKEEGECHPVKPEEGRYAIAEQLHCRVRSSKCHIPLVHGFPKVHKPEIPLDPLFPLLHFQHTGAPFLSTVPSKLHVGCCPYKYHLLCC